jgi:branched-subunit amino acid transport protein
MGEKTVFITILLMGAVTFIPRMLPALFLANRRLPDLFIRWLQYIPAAVLAALTLPAIMLKEKQLDVTFENLYFWIAIPTLLIALRTKSLFIPAVSGMVLIAITRYFIAM